MSRGFQLTISATKSHHRTVLQYIATRAFGLNPLHSAGCATALIAGKGPGLSSSALLHSSCSKTQLKAAHQALRPKITLHISHPECNADSSSHRVPFCGKWPPLTFSVRSYFWRIGKIFHSATRREITLQKKLFFSQPFCILWSWQSPQCGLYGNVMGHLSKQLHKSHIYLMTIGL